MKKQFESLLRNNERRLRFIAARYAKGSEHEDLYQEILLQLWKSMDSFGGQSDINTWVYRIALNVGISHVRAAVKQRSILDKVQNLFKSSDTPPQNACQADTLLQFMRGLSDIDAAIMMMYLDGIGLGQIADIAGMKSNSISKRISRIKSKFEQAYIGDVA